MLYSSGIKLLMEIHLTGTLFLFHEDHLFSFLLLYHLLSTFPSYTIFSTWERTALNQSLPKISNPPNWILYCSIRIVWDSAVDWANQVTMLWVTSSVTGLMFHTFDAILCKFLMLEFSVHVLINFTCCSHIRRLYRQTLFTNQLQNALQLFWQI